MNDNLDAPPGPRADATAPPVHEGPPPQVVMAIRLGAANYGLGLLIVVVFWNYFSSLQSTGALVLNQAFSLAFAVWIYYKIYVGRNWARMTLLVLCALVGLLSLSRVFMDKFIEVTAAAPSLAKAHMIVGPAITLVVLWLLFVSPGRHWFRRTSSGANARSVSGIH